MSSTSREEGDQFSVRANQTNSLRSNGVTSRGGEESSSDSDSTEESFPYPEIHGGSPYVHLHYPGERSDESESPARKPHKRGAVRVPPDPAPLASRRHRLPSSSPSRSSRARSVSSTPNFIREQLGVPITRRYKTDLWTINHHLPACSVFSQHGALDLEVTVHDHPVYKSFQTSKLTRDLSRVKEYASRECQIEVLTMTSGLKTCRIAGVAPPFGTDFAWAEPPAGGLVGSSQQWIHGQSNRLSIDAIKKLVLSLPQISPAGKTLVSTLLDFTKLEYEDSHVLVRKPEPFVRRAVTVDEDLENGCQKWALLFNMPYLSIGQTNDLPSAPAAFIQSQPLLQYLYPFETIDKTTENRQALLKAEYLSPKSSIQISSFWAATLSSGIAHSAHPRLDVPDDDQSRSMFITLCSKAFTSLHEPYLSSINDGQPTAKKVRVQISSDPSFAFVFPLSICGSYFVGSTLTLQLQLTSVVNANFAQALVSIISNAYQEFFENSVQCNYNLEGPGFEINETSWIDVCRQNATTIEIKIIIKALARSEESTKNSAGGNDKKDTARSEIDQFWDAHTSSDLNVIPFFAWAAEIQRSMDLVPAELKTQSRGRQPRGAHRPPKEFGGKAIDATQFSSCMDAMSDKTKQYFKSEPSRRFSARQLYGITSQRAVASFYYPFQSSSTSASIKETAAAAKRYYSDLVARPRPVGFTWYTSLAGFFEDLDLVSSAFYPPGTKHPVSYAVRGICETMLSDMKSVYEAVNKVWTTSIRPRLSDDVSNTDSSNLENPLFHGETVLFDRARLDEVDGSHLPNILTVDCVECRESATGRPFDSWENAIEHLQQFHVPDTISSDVTTSSLARFVVPKSHYLQFAVTAQIQQVMVSMIDELREAATLVRQIQAGACTDKSCPSCIFSVPSSLLEAFRSLILGLVYFSYTMSLVRDVWSSSAEPKDQITDSQTAELWKQAKGFFKDTKSKLQTVRVALEKDNLPPEHSAFDYYSDMGVAYLLCVTAGGLCDRIGQKDSLELLQAYEDYGQRLNYQVRKKPQRRIRNELVQCREEVATILSVFYNQRRTMKQLRDFLYPYSFEDAPSDRPFRNTLEQQALNVFVKKAHEREQFCKDLLAQFSRIENELVRAVEIDQDDHGKAILAFTIVTVIFLPLSFVTSFLGMNTTDIRNSTATQWLFWAAALPLTFVTMAGAVSIGYYGDQIRDGALALARTLVPGSARKHRSANDVSIGRSLQSDEIRPRRRRSKWKPTRVKREDSV